MHLLPHETAASRSRSAEYLQPEPVLTHEDAYIVAARASITTGKGAVLGRRSPLALALCTLCWYTSPGHNQPPPPAWEARGCSVTIRRFCHFSACLVSAKHQTIVGKSTLHGGEKRISLPPLQKNLLARIQQQKFRAIRLEKQLPPSLLRKVPAYSLAFSLPLHR